jgi:hemerythrin-like domain-containing protein
MRLEHEHLDKLWYDFSVEENDEESKKLFKTFTVYLLKHMSLEDEILAPIFNKYLGIEEGQTTVMKEDHKKLLKLLEKVKNSLESKTTEKATYNKTHFGRALMKHHKREDVMQYPLFDNFISQKDWEEISRVSPTNTL